MISITTLDPSLARRMEPRAAAPHRRLETIRELSRAGIPAGVLASPIIPGLNDSEIERILEACAEAGARSAGYILLRLPYEVKDLFREWLAEHYPLRAARILSLVRQCRSGGLNDPAYGSRMRGVGTLPELIRNRVDIARRRFGLDAGPVGLDHTQFRVPGTQKSLFGEPEPS
jgi:DNA repair photolyase